VRFMMLVKSAENSGPPPKELMEALWKSGEEAAKAGVMIDSGGLKPTAMSARVQLRGGKVTAIDGPFTESKEIIRRLCHLRVQVWAGGYRIGEGLHGIAQKILAGLAG
jgi:hypothetical protein